MATVIFEELRLIGFGKFKGFTLPLTAGVNLIYGENEGGKSTLQSFLCGMLYGFHLPAAKRRSYSPQQARYQPWDGGPYCGVLLCRVGERVYRIERSFDREQERVQIYDELTGEDVTGEFPYNPVTRLHEPGEGLLGLSQTAFVNTCSAAQLCCRTQEGLAAQLEERLASMMQTADQDLSLTAALEGLGRLEEEIGSPRRSKSPYGQAAAAKRELEVQLEEALTGEEEYLRLCCQLEEQRAKQLELEKEQKLLETKVQDTAAKELSGQFLKAQTIRSRLERLEKEVERYLPFEGIDPAVVESAQKKLAARSQIQRTRSKYERALEELEKRLGEMEQLYRTLELESQDPEVLGQFDRMYERYQNSLELEDELRQLRIKLNNVSFALGKLSLLDSSGLERDIREFGSLEGQLAQPVKPLPNPLARPLLWGGAALVLLGAALGILLNPWLWLLAAVGCGGCLLATRLKPAPNEAEESRMEQCRCRRQEILRRYRLAESGESPPLAQLEALLGKVQVNNYKYQHCQKQEQELRAEAEQKAARCAAARQEVMDYLEMLTGQPADGVDVVQMKALMETVKKAKRIQLELQKLNLQYQQFGKERDTCLRQVESINADIAQAVEACGVQDPEELDRCRAGRQRLMELRLEQQMQGELLEQCLGGYCFEELEQAANRLRAEQESGDGEGEAPVEDAVQRLEELRRQLGELGQQSARLEGQRQQLERTLRPPGVIRQELEELEERCHQYQTKLDALALAREKLSQVSAQIHRDVAPLLNQKLSQALALLTDGRYRRAVTDRQLNIRLEDPSGQLVPLEAVSGGTQDLIYLAMRLELASLLGQGGQLPLVLDDSMIQLDDRRAGKLLELLAGSGHPQILLFTCQKREERLLEAAGIGFTRHQLP